MAGREKKTKNLSNTNASREFPPTSKQTTLLSYISTTPGKAEGAEAMNPNSSRAESPAAPGKKGAASKAKGRTVTKKLNPNTKINTLRGRKKTKANFKLNIIKTQAKQSAAAKSANKRGRPPLKKAPVKESPEKADKNDKVVDDESPPLEDPGAKTRGRKRGTTNEGLEDKVADSPEPAKPSSTKDSDNKKTVMKNIPKKVVKKKQLIVAQKGLTKKKLLLAKQILKTDAKQVDPKVLKKNLTAKLKSVSEKLEAKKDMDKEAVQVINETNEPVIPLVEIKKEPELLDVPTSVPNSRSSSPRSASFRKRNSADLSVVSTKNLLTDISAVPAVIKSPYSTRSERSRSPFPALGENATKLLRNGKQRKAKGGLKNDLLSETIGQEFKKRRRLLSDTKLGDLSPETLDELKKVKRLRSYSRDGSEISKCSDITESDLSFCDTMSIDTEHSKILDNKEDFKEIKAQGISLEDIKTELSSPESSPVTAKAPVLEPDVGAASNTPEASAAVDNVQNKGDSMDNENNNTDEKIKTDALLVSEKLSIDDAIDALEESLKVSQSEKIAEKSLILDNMSKTFNDTSLSSKAKSIRRSARQRKSTVKAKEQEETEKDVLESDLSAAKIVKAETDNISTCSSLSEPVSEVPKGGIDKDLSCKPANTENSIKITTKKFYGDSSNQNEDTKSADLTTTAEPDILEKSASPKASDEISATSDSQDGDENVKLHFDEDDEHDEVPVDDSLKENIQTGYSNKAFSHQDIDKLIDKLRNFEELDKKRQEEKSVVAEKGSVMVTSDVVLIPKSNLEPKVPKDLPNITALEKAKDSVLSCFENNSAISIVKKETSRKSFDIELPSSVTLIKRTGTSSRKHSTGSTNSKDNDVSMIDKTLGKDVTLELRKSIDKGILSLESTLGATKSSTISTGNGQSISISLKPQPVANAVKDCVTVTPSQHPTATVTQALTLPASPVTALMSLPTPSPLLITPVPLGSSITPVANSADAIAPATITPIMPTTPSLISTPPTISSDIPKAQNALKLLNTQLIPETPSLLAKANSVSLALSIVPCLTILPAPTVPVSQTTTTISPAFIKTSSELTITAEVTAVPVNAVTEPPSITKILIPKSDTVKKVATLPTKSIPTEKSGKKVPEPVATLASITLPLVSCQVEEKKASTSPPPPVILPLVESPEKQKQKEQILRTLGLLTLKEADEAKLEKQKQKELLIKSSKANMPKSSTNNDGYTGTLKTVIKINRTSPDKKKSRSPLKMTFQKSKSRGSKLVSDGASGDSESDDSPHYTIHKEFGGTSGCGLGGAENHVTSDPAPSDPLGDVAVEATPTGKEAVSLVIPEKASSFAIHPGRLCLDQCFYCGGKFGLFDTPCHVAQIKSRDRQKKILDNEEKLTVDSCLCDACYRHVDRRANCPGYRRRAIGSGGPLAAACPPGTAGGGGAFCHANTCRRPAPHSLRRKWLVKMRGNVSKVVQLDLDYPGLHTIPLCDVHYQAISHLMVCGLCKRGLSRNHVHYINQEYQALNPLISELGLPVVFQERPVVCKLCRYFCTLLLRPPSNHQLNKKAFLTTYHRRLLLAHNLEIPAELEREVHLDISASEAKKDQSDSIKERKKGKTGKNKTKKSTDVRKSTEDMHSVKRAANAENFESNKKDESSWKERNSLGNSGHNIPKCGLEEDIESLISTNTIPIPNANSKAGSHSDTPVRPNSEVSDNSDLDMMIDYDNPLISALDKQSELQYLLQKCNVPASTVLQRGPISNLTQKSRNILKVHNAPAISKTSINQKIMDKNARRIQKLGQIITKNSDIEKALSGKLPNRDEFTIEAANNQASDATGLNMLRNIVLNDECTIETIPPKPSSKSAVDFNSLKSKLQMSDSFTQIKKNLKALSSRLSDDPQKKKKSDTRYSNPVRRLETNPSISVRELFPGEEEMNLHCAIEFGNVKGITPEGWEKCSTTIQYDTDTKKLWHELQKPYGNQSSFLRHLILLEKYFRNGDLILANNANCNAATYSESVQNRLRSYDNIPSNGDTVHLPYTGSLFPKNSSLTVVQHTASPPPLLPPETVLETVQSKKSESSSLIEFRRHKTTSAAGKSLLKTNQSMEHPKMPSHKGSANLARPLDSFLPPSVNHAKIPKNVPISIAQINQSVDQAFNASKIPKNVPLSLSQLEKLSNQLPQMHVPVTPRPPTPRPDVTKPTEFIRPPSLPSSIAIETKMSSSKHDSVHNKPRAPSLPPELIAINSQHSTQRKSIENVLKNIQQLAKGSSTPVSHSAPPPSLQTPGMSPISSAQPTMHGKLDEIPTVPAEPTPKKSKGSSKQWRPTLIPITDESKLRNARDVLYQTADGRRLPSLVQVMSGGKPYHITIQDYNRMCVMRREKLQQMQRAELSKKSSGSATALLHGISLDPSLDLPIVPAVAVPGNKPASPNTTLPDIPNVQSLTNSKNTDQVSPTSVKTSSLPEKTSPSSSVPEVSLLKNVSLKNVSIAPIASLGDGRSSKSPVSPPNSLLITTGGTVSLPSIISQLGSSISVTTELAPKASLVAAAPVAPLSISPLLPKMPSSLTVTPQPMAPSQVPPPSVTPPKP